MTRTLSITPPTATPSGTVRRQVEDQTTRRTDEVGGEGGRGRGEALVGTERAARPRGGCITPAGPDGHARLGGRGRGGVGVSPWVAQRDGPASGLILRARQPAGSRRGPRAPTRCRRSSTSSSTCRRTTPTTTTSACSAAVTASRSAGRRADQHATPTPTASRVRSSTRPARATSIDGASQSWNASHLSWNGGAMDGFVTAVERRQRVHGLLGRHRPALLLRPRQHVPALRPLVLLGARRRRTRTAGTCRRPPRSASCRPTSTRSSPRPTAPNGTIWDRLNAHGITWNDYAIDLADILLFPQTWPTAPTTTRRARRSTEFLADCATGTLPQVSIVSPGLHDQYAEETPADIQLGEAYSASIINAVMQQPAVGEDGAVLHVRRARRLLRPRAAARRGRARRHRARASPCPPDQPGDFDRYGIRVPALRDLAVRQARTTCRTWCTTTRRC